MEQTGNVMFESVVLPLDGSKASEYALPCAAVVAAGLGSCLFIIRVCEQAPDDREASCQAYLDSIVEKIKLEFRNKTRRPAALEHEVLKGNTASEILRYAGEKNAGLIVMSRHGISDEGPWFLGSIADKVLRAASHSVLLVKAPPAHTAGTGGTLIRKVLLPLDGSAVGEAAIPGASALSRALAAELVLFRVVVPSSLHHESFQGFMTPALKELVAEAREGEEERMAAAADYLVKLQQSLSEQGIASSAVTALGYPPDEIVDYAAEQDIDLIAMSSHGRTGIGRWMFGSVTDKVLRAGDTPVLVVRARPV